MARSRRRSTSRAPRVRRDWVYRGAYVDGEGSLDWTLASYCGIYRTISGGGGVPESTAWVLYDSQNYFKDVAGQGGVTSRASRAEGKRARCYRVMGQINWTGTTWTLGDEVRFGLRLGVFNQDPADGGILVPAAYGMMTEGGSLNDQTSIWANARGQNLWEHRNYQYFATGAETSNRTLKVNIPISVSLGPDECLAMYMEQQGGGVGLRYVTWLRTLVSDEG